MAACWSCKSRLVYGQSTPRLKPIFRGRFFPRASRLAPRTEAPGLPPVFARLKARCRAPFEAQGELEARGFQLSEKGQSAREALASQTEVWATTFELGGPFEAQDKLRRGLYTCFCCSAAHH